MPFIFLLKSVLGIHATQSSIYFTLQLVRISLFANVLPLKLHAVLPYTRFYVRGKNFCKICEFQHHKRFHLIAMILLYSQNFGLIANYTVISAIW